MAAGLVFAASCASGTMSDDDLLDVVEKATIGYFTDFADPSTGLAYERNNDLNGKIVTIGGSGFGMMAVIAGAERGYYPVEEGVQRVEKMVSSLEKLERFHGAWAHWYNAQTMQPSIPSIIYMATSYGESMASRMPSTWTRPGSLLPILRLTRGR